MHARTQAKPEALLHFRPFELRQLCVQRPAYNRRLWSQIVKVLRDDGEVCDEDPDTRLLREGCKLWIGNAIDLKRIRWPFHSQVVR